MRFAKAHPAVDEEGVVGIRRRFGYSEGCRVGEAVTGAHHKRFKGVALVQLRRRLADDGCAAFVLLGLFGRKDRQLQVFPAGFLERRGDKRGIARHHKLMVKIGLGLDVVGFSVHVKRAERTLDPRGIRHVGHLRVHEVTSLLPDHLVIQVAFSKYNIHAVCNQRG